MTKLIPRHVNYTYNSGRMLTEVICEPLIEEPSESYEVTCPNEPDNDPEQPQDELPEEPPWPDIGEGNVLTRNSWRSGNLFESIDDPIAVKSIAGMGANPKCAELNGGNGITGSPILSSNNYVYWIHSLVAYRKAIKSGKTDKSFTITDYWWDIAGLTLVEENVLIRVVQDTATHQFHIIKLDFTDISETILESIDYIYDEYEFELPASGNAISVVGNNNKVYVVVPVVRYESPDVGDWGFSNAYFYVYNYTDSVLYDPIILDLWDKADVGDIASVDCYYAPTIVHSEVVFAFLLGSWIGGFPETDKGFPIFCINAETQTGQASYPSSYSYNGHTYVPFYPYGMVSDRMYRRVYISVESDTEPYDVALTEYPIFRYDLASNSVDIESHRPRIDATGPIIGGNFPFLIQDKDHAYKFTNLYCADTSGDPDIDKTNCTSLEPMFSRIEDGYSVDLFNPIKLEYLPYNEYDIDDVTGTLYTIDHDNKCIWRDYYGSSIMITAVPNPYRLYLQGDHILIEMDTRKFWVVYP